MTRKINGIELHNTLTDEVIMDACAGTLDNPGFCILCGNEASGCEPDARNYKCEACGAEQVFGCEELFMTVVF